MPLSKLTTDQIRKEAEGHTLRDELAKKEGSPYHETSEARVMAFKNGWNACIENEPLGKLIKRFGEKVHEAAIWKEKAEGYEKALKEIQKVYKSPLISAIATKALEQFK